MKSLQGRQHLHPQLILTKYEQADTETGSVDQYDRSGADC